MNSPNKLRSFTSDGRWAGERLQAALAAGRPLSPAELRTLDTLREDEWVSFDEALVEEAEIRLVGVGDLMGRNLTRPIPNAMGKTILRYETVADMEAAIVSLDGATRGDNDAVDFSPVNVPLPIIHKDFNLHLRTLEASRERGESLDTTQARVAGRLCTEQAEKLLFQGGPTFGAAPIYGYTTHTSRNTGSYQTNGNWAQSAKTGANMLEDVLFMKAALETDRFYGPFGLYLPTGYGVQIDDDFKANSDKTIRQRLLEVDGLELIKVADQMPADEIVMVQLTPDVVQWGEGETLQTIQWDIGGGFVIAFKAFMIGTPIVKADAQGRSGVYHMS